LCLSGGGAPLKFFGRQAAPAGVELRDKSGELLSLQALHENVIHSIRSALITTDLEGRVTLMNAPAKSFGAHSVSVYGRHVSELFVDRLPNIDSASARSAA